MTAIAVDSTRTDATSARPALLPTTIRFELTKLLSTWRLRVILLACLIGPAGFVIAVSKQSNLPTDTVFGRWMHQTGWAGALVILCFCCQWALPLLTALVAGDVFASEDRLGTWRHLLMAVRSPRRIFAAKTIASVGVILAMITALAVSAIAGGLVAVGNHPLVGLDGSSIAPGRAAALVVTAWAYVALASLAFAAVGLLGSVLFGRSPVGLFAPAALALGLEVLQMLPLPVAVRLALPSAAFGAWRGLFTDPIQTGPLVIAAVVSLAWTLAAAGLAYWLFQRRDFTDLAYDGGNRRAIALGLAPLVGVGALCVAGASMATPGSLTSSGLDGNKIEHALATSYSNLYVLQTSQLHRPAVTAQQLRTTASCQKGDGSVDVGAGNDWRCVVSWHLPDTQAVGQAIYQLDVAPDGKFTADGDGPKEVNGYFLLHTPTGDAANPLWQVDGLVDLSRKAPPTATTN